MLGIGGLIFIDIGCMLCNDLILLKLYHCLCDFGFSLRMGEKSRVRYSSIIPLGVIKVENT